MGSAEERQAQRITAAERVQRETRERSERYAGTLGEIRRKREARNDIEARFRGAEKGVRAAVGMAIQQDDPPPDSEVLEAAEWTVEQLAELRASFSVRYPG